MDAFPQTIVGISHYCHYCTALPGRVVRTTLLSTRHSRGFSLPIQSLHVNNCLDRNRSRNRALDTEMQLLLRTYPYYGDVKGLNHEWKHELLYEIFSRVVYKWRAHGKGNKYTHTTYTIMWTISV